MDAHYYIRVGCGAIAFLIGAFRLYDMWMTRRERLVLQLHEDRMSGLEYGAECFILMCSLRTMLNDEVADALESRTSIPIDREIITGFEQFHASITLGIEALYTLDALKREDRRLAATLASILEEHLDKYQQLWNCMPPSWKTLMTKGYLPAYALEIGDASGPKRELIRQIEAAAKASDPTSSFHDMVKVLQGRGVPQADIIKAFSEVRTSLADDITAEQSHAFAIISYILDPREHSNGN